MFAPANQSRFNLSLPRLEHGENLGHEVLSQPPALNPTRIRNRPDLDLAARLEQLPRFAVDTNETNIYAHLHAATGGDAGLHLTSHALVQQLEQPQPAQLPRWKQIPERAQKNETPLAPAIRRPTQ
ncbi:hypothetical protein D9M68_689690 [compost metagenome]